MRDPFQLFVLMGWWLVGFCVVDALVVACPAIAVILAVLSFCLHGVECSDFMHGKVHEGKKDGTRAQFVR